VSPLSSMDPNAHFHTLTREEQGLMNRTIWEVVSEPHSSRSEN
jgi:hypothetical protein